MTTGPERERTFRPAGDELGSKLWEVTKGPPILGIPRTGVEPITTISGKSVRLWWVPASVADSLKMTPLWLPGSPHRALQADPCSAGKTPFRVPSEAAVSAPAGTLHHNDGR
jgi:hypothetical protein